MINTPNKSVGEAQPYGWMNADLYLKWFVKYSNYRIQNPLLFILDGHASLKYSDVFEFSRKKNSHAEHLTSHDAQPTAT